MPELILPLTFLNLIAEFRGVFTAPSYENFRVLVFGFVHALGRHGITDALRAAGVAAEKHYSVYYRFFSRAIWSPDELGLCLLAVVIRVFGVEAIELVLDDTLARRSGKKVALATMHADPVNRGPGGRPFTVYGQIFVVLSVHVRIPLLGRTGWALPFLFRLYQGSKRGGRANSPSDRGRALARRLCGKKERTRMRLTDLTVIDGQLKACAPRFDESPLPDDLRPTKLALAAELLLLVARRFPNVQFRVLADHLYAANAVLHEVHRQGDNVHFVMRGRGDAALYELPPAPRPGTRGRPRVRGMRLPTPEQWAADNPDKFQRHTVMLYGHHVEVLVASFVGMAYRSLPGRLVRYVVVKDPRGIYKTDYIFSTDPHMGLRDIVLAYGRRWPLERTFQESKQKLGMEDHQTQLPQSVRRCAPFTMFIYSLVVLWYLLDGHRLAQALAGPRDPWYDKHGRPSFSDMLACLRRASWAEAIIDPPLADADRSKSLVESLVRMVASG